MTSKRTMLQAVRDFVYAERERLGIQEAEPGVHPRDESSCEAVGEFKNLLFAQLLYTKVGYGEWSALEDPKILQGVYEEVQKVLRERAA